MLKFLCRLFGHKSESYERIEWTPSADADPLEKAIGHCRCSRCRFAWEEVIYDRDKIDAELRRVEMEIESNPIHHGSTDDIPYSLEELCRYRTPLTDGPID